MAQNTAFQDYKFLDTVQGFIDAIPEQYTRPRVGPVSHPEGVNLSLPESAANIRLANCQIRTRYVLNHREIGR